MEIIKQFEPLFGEWCAESLIGTGSFGRVYKIRREDYGARYYSALKYISLPQSDTEIKQLRYEGMDEESLSVYYGEMVKDISAEIQLMYRLRGNTNIVAYEDHKILPKPGSAGFDIFIRMELLTNLNEYIMQNRVSTESVLKLGTDLCSALALCGTHRIIHRDIKPDNIFVSENGAFKLGDFGIARQLERTNTNLSKKGTYNYMAPEVFRGDHYDATCDLYSLGIAMYRLLNNNRLPLLPQVGVPLPADREQALARRMRGDTLPLPANAQNRLGEIVLKACAFDPKERFQTPAEMQEALDTLRGGEEVLAAIPPVVVNMPTKDITPQAPAKEEEGTKSLWDNPRPSTEEKPVTSPSANAADVTVSLFDVGSVSQSSSTGAARAPAEDSSVTKKETSEPRKKKRGGLIAVLAASLALLSVLAICVAQGKGKADPTSRIDASVETHAIAPEDGSTLPPTTVPTEVAEITPELVPDETAESSATMPVAAPETPKPTAASIPTATQMPAAPTSKPTPTSTSKPTPTPTPTPKPTPTPTPPPTMAPWTRITSVPAGATIVQYKWVYTLRELTTSTSSTLSGWIQYGTPTVSYGAWGAWTAWSTSNPGASTDTFDVESQWIAPTYTTRYYYYHYCGRLTGSTRVVGTTRNYVVNQGATNINYCTTYCDGAPLTTGAWNKTGHSCAPNGVDYWFSNGSEQVVATPGRTEWRYRTRTKTTTYYYYKDTTNQETTVTSTHVAFPYSNTSTKEYKDQVEWVQYYP